MTQTELNRAVSTATSESVSTIKSIGFSLVEDPPEHEPADQQILVLDCPFCGTTVLLSASGPEALPEFAECRRCDVVYDYSSDEVYVAEPTSAIDEALVSAA